MAAQVASLTVETLPVPGHTPDGLAFRIRAANAMVVGDYLSTYEFPFVYHSTAAYRGTGAPSSSSRRPASSGPTVIRAHVRGQIKTMGDSFTGLLIGLAGAIILVYLLIVVNFQSWLDPFIIVTALPAAYRGTVAALVDALEHDPPGVIVPGHGDALDASRALALAAEDLRYLHALRAAVEKAEQSVRNEPCP